MKRPALRSISHIAMFSALIAVCAWITIPFAVPFTMQTFAVFLAAGFLGPKRSAAAVGVYLMLGLAGAPVFSGFQGGPGVLLGPAGGYLAGFIPGVLISGALIKRFGMGARSLAGAFSLGSLVIYACGTAWYALGYASSLSAGLSAALTQCVLPFLLPDAAKLLLAALVLKRLRKHPGI